MQKTATKPPKNDLYATDFYAWTQEQARAVEEGRWSDADAVNIAEEIRSLGRAVKDEIADRIEILLSYLLKWRHFAEYRGLAWKENIDRQRHELADLFEESSTLVPMNEQFVAAAYENSRRRLKYETYLMEIDFPASCPFTTTQVFDSKYFPEELDAPATGQFPTAPSIGR
jgi:Domain of unknown function DUF29